MRKERSCRSSTAWTPGVAWPLGFGTFGATVVVLGLPRRRPRGVRGGRDPRGTARRDRRAQARCSLPARARDGSDRRGRRARPQRRRAPAAGITDQELAVVEQREGAEVGPPGRSLPRRPCQGRARRTNRRRRRRRTRDRRTAGPRCRSLGPRAPPRWCSRSRWPRRQLCTTLAAEADEVVALYKPQHFSAVGEFYLDFTQTTDEEVVGLLAAAHSAAVAGADDPLVDDDVVIPAPGVELGGRLTIPDGAFGDRGVRSREREQPPQSAQPVGGPEAQRCRSRNAAVRPAHGPRSDRPGQRVRRGAPRRAARRGARWVRAQPRCGFAAVGYFGASTGAAAALWASGRSRVARGEPSCSRGGRPGPRVGPAPGGHRTHAAHRRRGGPRGDRAQPGRGTRAPVRASARDRPRRDPPLRGARGAGASRRSRGAVVRRASHSRGGGASPTSAERSIAPIASTATSPRPRGAAGARRRPMTRPRRRGPRRGSPRST